MERGEGLIEPLRPCPDGSGRSNAGTRRRSAGRRLADLFHGRPGLQAGALLAGPVGWLVVGYLGSLAVLLVTSFWTLGELSGEIEQTFTLDNFKDVVYHRRLPRRHRAHGGDRGAVTVTDALLAFPIAFYMAKIAGPRRCGPCWSSPC